MNPLMNVLVKGVGQVVWLASNTLFKIILWREFVVLYLTGRLKTGIGRTREGG